MGSRHGLVSYVAGRHACRMCPERDPHHAVLLAMLHRAAAAVEQAQDAQSSLWYQILDKPGAKENYIESSSVLMFTYCLRERRTPGIPARALRHSRGTGMESHPATFRPHDSQREKWKLPVRSRISLSAPVLQTTGVTATICMLRWWTTTPRAWAPFCSPEAKWNCCGTHRFRARIKATRRSSQDYKETCMTQFLPPPAVPLYLHRSSGSVCAQSWFLFCRAHCQAATRRSLS